jgi:hypothetical protein
VEPRSAALCRVSSCRNGVRLAKAASIELRETACSPKTLYGSLEKGAAGIVCYGGPKLVEFRPMQGWQRGTAFIEHSQEVKHEEDAGHT